MKKIKQACEDCAKNDVYLELSIETQKDLKARLNVANAVIELIAQRHILAHRHKDYEFTDPKSDDIPF